MKKSLESRYPRPWGGTSRSIHGFATAISILFTDFRIHPRPQAGVFCVILIKNFIQLIFLTWALLLLTYWSRENRQGLTVVRKTGELLQWIRDCNMILSVKNVLNCFGVYPPQQRFV